MPEIDIGRFEEMYLDAEAANRGLFAEQRSNIQLYAGDHYARLTERLRSHEREGKITEEARIRLTENHIQRICKRYINTIYNTISGIGFDPKNRYEPSDKKNAEIFQSVYDDLRERLGMNSSLLIEIFNFVVAGELWVITKYDPKRGFAGYIEGQDENGMLVREPKFTGEFSREIVPAYDMLTSPAKVPWDVCPYVFYRKLVQTKNLKKLFPDKADMITESSGSKEFRIWNTITHDYEATKKGMSLSRELYIRPNSEFEEGWYAIADENIILDQGPLPPLPFPVSKVGFDDIEQSPRSRSIIKQLRPVQAEINRMISKMAEHQITLGDDKLVTFDGATVSSSVKLPGIRHVKVNGQIQQVVPGRTGDQYLEPYARKVATIYQIAMLEEMERKETAAQDPWALLYRSMSQRKQFNIYEQKFHDFQKSDALNMMQSAQYYYDPDRFVMAAGSSEAINIEEFKSKDPLAVRIKVVERSKDLDTQFAKQLAIQHMIQFLGTNMPPEIMQRIIAGMPFLLDEDIAQEISVDTRSIENDILALDRGKFVPADPSDNHDLYMKKLNARMKEPDFEYVKSRNPQIEQMYKARIQQHSQIKAEQMRQLQAAQQQFIPMGGGMVAVNLSAPDPKTGKNHRLYLPSSSLEWLMKKLEEQGMTMGQFQQLPAAMQAQTASILRQSSGLAEGQPSTQQMQAPAGQQQRPMARPNIPTQARQPAIPTQARQPQMPPDQQRQAMLNMVRGG